MRKNLTKLERLGKKTEVKNVFASGKRYSIPGVRLVFKKNDLEFSRFMISLVRGYGNSICRNRAKRLAREVYRLNKHLIKPGFDIVIIFFSDNEYLNDVYSTREKQIIMLLNKAGLYSKKGEINH